MGQSVLVLSTTLLLVIIKLFQTVNYRYKTPGTKSNRLRPQDVAVVTGGARGLGLEMVKQLVAHNLKVIVLDQQEPESEFGEFVKCDVGDKDQYTKALTSIVHSCNVRGDHISVFINNAGVRHSKSILKMEDKEIMNIYNVNVLSFIWGVRIVLKNHQQGKPLAIVTISSVLGMVAPRNLSIYSSTKAALSQAHEGLLEELVDHPDIRPLLVLPGQLLSGMFDDILPSRLFFAPIVDHIKLAKTIITKVDKGEVGTVCVPLYGNLLPIVKCLPYCLVRVCRWFAELDTKVKDEPDEIVSDN